MNNQHSSSIEFFVLSDSHCKRISPIFTTSSYNLITRSIPGLKWVDYYDQKLSVYGLLSSPEIHLSLSRANAVLFLVGTNSVRILPATQIISQIQDIVRFVQQNYHHLNESGKVSISLTFPCFKTTRRFPTETSLISNINSYNEKLKLLSSQMNFNIVDFNITNNHLANDNMHIHSRFNGLLFDSIINHFNQFIQTTSTSTTTSNSAPTLSSDSTPTLSSASTNTATTDSPLPSTSTNIATTDPPLPLASTSTSDKEKPSRSSKRSRESLDRSNKKGQQKMRLKQQQHTITRKINNQWTIKQIKQYLDSLHIRYGYIPQIYNNILRLQFNNQHDQDFADTTLGIDIFNEQHNTNL